MSTQSEAMRKWFDLHGIKNIDIVERMGLSPGTVSNMLSGRTPIGRKRAKDLHEAYGFDTQFLISGYGNLTGEAGINQTNVNGNNNVKVGEDIRRYADAAIKAKDEVIEANRQVIEANTKLLEAKEQIIELLKQLSEK